jgi:hypothetical protein
MVIMVTPDVEYAGDTSARAEAAVKVNPFRGLGSSIIPDNLDWNSPKRLFDMAAMYLTFNL